MVHVAVMSLLLVLGHGHPEPGGHGHPGPGGHKPPPGGHQCHHDRSPLYLREPLCVPMNDRNDAATTALLNTQFPLLDNYEFLKTWTKRFNESRQSSQAGVTPLPHTPPQHRDGNAYKRSYKHYVPEVLSININDIERSFKAGESMYQETLHVERRLIKANLSLNKRSASDLHQRLFRRTHPLTQLFSSLGFIMDLCTNDLLHKLLDNPDLPYYVTPLDLQLLGPVQPCVEDQKKPEVGPCDPSMRYRTINGTCNNIQNPTLGSAFSPFRRLVPPDYGDGVMSLRVAQDGTQLPSARLVSTTINSQKKSAATSFSFLHLTLGQFLDHDITNTPVVKGANDTTIPCCKDEVRKNAELLHPECAPIPIPFNDPFYSTYAATCMEFTRSVPAERCTLGPREQVNQITAFLDGSSIYGSTDEDSDNLREGKGGRLLTIVGKNGENLLQPSLDPDDGCNDEENFNQGEFCFISGDDRVNEQITLTLMHTVWTREHNRVAGELQRLNPAAPDELLYQEARRIVVAELQHIMYNEFLPGVLGKTLMKRLNLLPLRGGSMTSHYTSNIDPGIANEFATAAYRFGHSMIPDNVLQVNKEGKTSSKQLNDVLFRPFDLYQDQSTSKIARGGNFQNVLEVDPLFTEQVTGKLFQGRLQFGLDLVALNVQRGRDHGIGSYLTLRQACGLPKITSFAKLKSHLVPGAVKRLQYLYKTVEDIDLFAGGISERLIDGSQVGPTFACILADQFLRLKIGDRFWYEEDRPDGFTRDQLKELHRVSFARLLCDNTRGTHTMARWPLQVPSAFNPQLPCDSDCFPSINFKQWKADLLRAEHKNIRK